MRKKIVLFSLLGTMMLAVSGCGSKDELDEKKDAKEVKETKVKVETVKASDLAEDKESAIYDFLGEVKPTYTTNKSDVSSLCFGNELVELDKDFMNLQKQEGIAYLRNNEFFEGFEDMVKTPVTEEDPSLHVIVPEEFCINPMNYYITFDTMDYFQWEKEEYAYEDIVATGAVCTTLGIGDENAIEDVFNVKSELKKDEDEDYDASEFVDYLSSLWGEPSIARFEVGENAALYWCFEKTSIRVTFSEIGDKVRPYMISLHWADCEQLCNLLKTVENGKFIG